MAWLKHPEKLVKKKFQKGEKQKRSYSNKPLICGEVTNVSREEFDEN